MKQNQPNKSVIRRMRCLRRRRPAYAATVLRPVYESSFWTSKELQETSLNRRRISRLRNQKKNGALRVAKGV